MLFGDPFLDFPEYPEISTTTTTTSSTTTTTLPTCQEACSGKLFSCTASVVNPDPTCVSSNSKCNYAKEQKFGTSCSGNCWCYLQDDCPNCGSNHVCTSLGCIPQAESNCEQNCNRADGCNSPDNFYYGGYYRDYYCSAQTNRCEFINLGCKKECVNLCSYYQQLDPERGYTCCDPNTTSSTSTSTTTTSTSTTTTIPTEFTLTNFDCNSVSEGCYECFIQYPTTSQKTVVFLVSDSNGKIWKSGLENINTGSTESKTTFCCDTLTGTHKISYWVYDDSYMSNLITWSTSNQKKDVECG